MEIAATSLSSTPEPALNPNAAVNRQLAGAVRTLNNAGTAGPGREFSFAIDPQTRLAVVRIVDAGTRELVEQVPSEYILNVAQELSKIFPLKAPGVTDKPSVEKIA